MATPALATSVTPVYFEGNPRLSTEAGDCLWLKVDPPVSGTYTKGDLTVTVTFSDAGKYVEWISNQPIGTVIVKGGPGAYIYSYDPAATGDTGLRSPLNPGGNIPQISWVGFIWCGDGGGGPQELPILQVFKFYDANANRVKDAGEVELDDWTIRIGNATWSEVYLTPVEINLPPGDYTVTETMQSGWGNTTPTSFTVTLLAGETKVVEFGNVPILQVTKTANPTFTRTYSWAITKDVDKTSVKQVGGSATFNYTVKGDQTAFTDSNWTVSGNITVTNPSDYGVTGVDVSDTMFGLSWPDQTVPANGNITLPYTYSYSSQPAYNTDITNTATATYADGALSEEGTATFQFTGPTTTVNKTVTITDTFNGSTTTLGTLTATDALPYASATFTYARIVAVPTWNCVSYINTARIVETDQWASQTVTVCGPAKTGALSKGFWQNKNGQDIIKTGASISGVAKSGTWLRQYAPFQDLSTTATPSQVATYVYNVIKAANAGGAAMNAMLKAQMLATALDVYFSDPALGGNKISAPAPIGGVCIDLTKIYKGSGTYENVSGAFGGATSKTVLQMLTYAASQSNGGGSIWYGQVKATQELAKDAFDAIDNQWAFSCP